MVQKKKMQAGKTAKAEPQKDKAKKEWGFYNAKCPVREVMT